MLFTYLFYTSSLYAIYLVIYFLPIISLFSLFMHYVSIFYTVSLYAIYSSMFFLHFINLYHNLLYRRGCQYGRYTKLESASRSAATHSSVTERRLTGYHSKGHSTKLNKM